MASHHGLACLEYELQLGRRACLGLGLAEIAQGVQALATQPINQYIVVDDLPPKVRSHSLLTFYIIYIVDLMKNSS